MSSQSFKLRRLTTPQEVHDMIFAKGAAEGWRPGALDHVNYFAADNSIFFVGELDGKPICSVFYIKHSKDYVYGGGFLVDKQYRGKRYGVQMVKSTFALLGEKCNYGTDIIPDMILYYFEMFGFKPEWYQQCFDLTAYEASQAERNHLKSTEIVTPSTALFPALLDYDTHVHVFPRRAFLEKWVFAPNCYCSVAVNSSSGSVVGYGVVRTTFGTTNDWRIGPLFADNSEIARSLCQDLCVKVAAKEPQAVITLDVAYGKNFSPDSLQLVTELGGNPTFKMIRAYMYGVPPNTPLHKIFVMT